MDVQQEGYKPPAEFVKDDKDPLVGISLTDSTELWLIQWPVSHPVDFGNEELSLKLNCNGKLGSFENSSGKVYDIVSFAAQEPDATVILASGSDSKIIGKVSRRVSIINYPDPNEIEKNSSHLPSINGEKSAGSQKSSFSTPTRSSGHRISHGTSSREKSSLITGGTSLLSGELSKQRKRKNTAPASPSKTSSDRHSQYESRSSVSSLGTGHSHHGKSKN